MKRSVARIFLRQNELKNKDLQWVVLINLMFNLFLLSIQRYFLIVFKAATYFYYQ